MVMTRSILQKWFLGFAVVVQYSTDWWSPNEFDFTWDAANTALNTDVSGLHFGPLYSRWVMKDVLNHECVRCLGLIFSLP